jgi:hypothetical protein
LAFGVEDANDPTACPWFTTPPKPGSSAAAAAKSDQQARDEQLMSNPLKLTDVCKIYGPDGPDACQETKQDVAGG